MTRPPTAAQRRVIDAAEPVTGRLRGTEAQLAALVRRGLAFRHPRPPHDHFLTPAGHRIREAEPEPEPVPEPSQSSAGGFAARVGGEEDAGPSGPARAREVHSAWQGLLELRRMTNPDGSTDRPCGWERTHLVRAAALALEAAGHRPAGAEDGTDGRPRGAARGTDGEPAGANGVPGRAGGVPGRAGGVPGRAGGVPGGANGVPGGADGVPGGADGVPGGADGVPGRAGGGAGVAPDGTGGRSGAGPGSAPGHEPGSRPSDGPGSTPGPGGYLVRATPQPEAVAVRGPDEATLRACAATLEKAGWQVGEHTDPRTRARYLLASPRRM